MPYGYDPSKAVANQAKHGIAFDAAQDFDWATAVVAGDTRQSYGEVRLVAYGAIGTRLHALVFTIRPNMIWIISLRKANRTEVQHYASQG